MRRGRRAVVNWGRRGRRREAREGTGLISLWFLLSLLGALHTFLGQTRAQGGGSHNGRARTADRIWLKATPP